MFTPKSLLREHLTDTSELHSLAERIRGTFTEPFVVDARDVTIAASVGASPAAPSPRELLDRADEAMYLVKRTHRIREP